MNQWLIIDLIVFMTVTVLAGFIIPQILLIAFRKNLFDSVDPRKIHKGAVPRLGGIAFFPTILFALLMTFGIIRLYAPGLQTEILESCITSFCFIIGAVIILYLVGMADDLIGLKYRAKFVAQIICAAIVVAGGVYLDNLHGFFGIHALPFGVSIALTILLTVFITNAINLIDGIDGLASGLSAIACAFYGYIFFNAGLHVYGMVAFATVGALVPFFYYNVFGNATKHSKIFMGDTGALTIGLILSVLSIRICMMPDTPSPLTLNPSSLTLNPSSLTLPPSSLTLNPSSLTLNPSSSTLNPLTANYAVIAFAPLLIPCFDVVRVYLHRIKAHRNPFLPDKTHIHHKLLALGMSQRVAMPTIVGTSFLLTLANYYLSALIPITLLFAADLLLWILANMALSRAIRRRSLRLGKVLYQ